jgi:hypothetical protein
VSQENLQILGKDTTDSMKQNSADEIHPLEMKYGKEPKIEPQEHWSWH